MKNVTITLDEKVARWLRVWAARNDTSVSRIVGDMLRQRMEQEEGYEVAMQRFLSREPAYASDGKPYPKRDELHD